MKTAPTQNELVLPTPNVLRFPLWPVAVVVVVLDRSPAEVLKLADELEYVWDLRTPDAERKSELRFLGHSVVAHKRGVQGGVCGLTEAAVYNLIAPSHKGKVRALTLYTRFLCTQGHVANLIAAGCFTAATAAQRGPGGSPEVTRESVIQFLKTRRMSR